MLQFHGSESPQRVADTRARFGRKVIKAVPIAGPDDLVRAGEHEDAADFLLFDAKPPSRPERSPAATGWLSTGR